MNLKPLCQALAPCATDERKKGPLSLTCCSLTADSKVLVLCLQLLSLRDSTWTSCCCTSNRLVSRDSRSDLQGHKHKFCTQVQKRMCHWSTTHTWKQIAPPTARCFLSQTLSAGPPVLLCLWPVLPDCGRLPLRLPRSSGSLLWQDLTLIPVRSPRHKAVSKAKKPARKRKMFSLIFKTTAIVKLVTGPEQGCVLAKPLFRWKVLFYFDFDFDFFFFYCTIFLFKCGNMFKYSLFACLVSLKVHIIAMVFLSLYLSSSLLCTEVKWKL